MLTQFKMFIVYDLKIDIGLREMAKNKLLVQSFSNAGMPIITKRRKYESNKA